MASLTIRKLDEAIKSYLRLRSARNGRSVEEEVRVILREYTQGRPIEAAALLQPAETSSAVAGHTSATGEARVTLIIGGGIAAHKALDPVPRPKERPIRVPCGLAKAPPQFVHPLAASA